MTIACFTGEFETHITVGNYQVDRLDLDRLQAWCADRNLKFLHIVLDAEGISVANRSQPMLTRRG